MDNKKNIIWINTVKAICILAVFLVHCQSYYGVRVGEVTNQVVHTFYVNAFFFISGYLLFWKQLSPPKILEDKKFYKRIGGKQLYINVLYRVIIPSVIFSAIEFLPSCLLQGRGIDLGFALYKTIGGGTYWFTSALVVAELILLSLFCTRKMNIWFYAAICLVLGVIGLLIVKSGILKSNIWAWKQGLISLIFLAMGGIYWRYERQIDKLAHWWFIIPLVIAFMAMVIGLKGYNDPVISTLTIQPLGFVTSAMACLLLVWLCKILPEIKPLDFIGRNSLGFYFMSGALPISLSLIVHKVLAANSIWMMLTIWIVCVVVAYVAVRIIRDCRNLTKNL